MAKAKKKPAKKKPAPKAKKAPKPKVALAGDELLIEELGEARLELKRVATQESYARKQIEADLESERAAAERLRQELEAVRLDLKTALADLEIARAEAQREGSRAKTAARELTAALDGQRAAEHALNSARDELFELRRDLDMLKKAP
jgi:chromosome segregation ATPase